MRRFAYASDGAFLLGCAMYAANRCLLRPHVHAGFMRSHFDDLWLIPCALPPILWLHRRLGLRTNDDAPTFAEVALHVVFWSALFEWIGPKFVAHATGDVLDVVAYVVGGTVAWLWWQRASFPRAWRATALGP